MAERERLVGADRCWRCTFANGFVALLVAGVPLLAGVLRGDWVLLAVTATWAVGVLGYSLYRLIGQGYLPGAGRIARWTGLHDRIGPGAADDESGTDDGGPRR